MGGLTVLVGGARSGKSSLAVSWGRRHADAGGDVVFVATASAPDADMAQRIARHRAERPAWHTIEEPHDLVGAVDGHPEALVIVDCLTLWVSNLMHRGDGDSDIVARAETTAAALADRTAPTLAITNEVGMGVHPESDLGRRYRDVLGIVNQAFAAKARRALLLVAGRTVEMLPADVIEL
jgi:adenosylcobinamide kinase/adenosylcobinamide-phosphate guanylyltransferase